MAESRRAGAQGLKESEGRSDHQRPQTESDRNRERAGQSAQQQGERSSEIGREGRQAADVSTAAAGGMARPGSGTADCAQEITAAWAWYAEQAMRHSSEASRALLRARSFSEILEVQAQLLRNNMQAFLDQSREVAEAGRRRVRSRR